MSSIPAPANAPLREHPVTVGLLVMVLVPILSFFTGVAGFTYVRVDKLNDGLGELRVEVARVSTRLNVVERRLDQLEARISAIEVRIGRLEEGQAKILGVMQEQTGLLRELIGQRR